MHAYIHYILVWVLISFVENTCSVYVFHFYKNYRTLLIKFYISAKHFVVWVQIVIKLWKRRKVEKWQFLCAHMVEFYRAYHEYEHTLIKVITTILCFFTISLTLVKYLTTSSYDNWSSISLIHYSTFPTVCINCCVLNLVFCFASWLLMICSLINMFTYIATHTSYKLIFLIYKHINKYWRCKKISIIIM